MVIFLEALTKTITIKKPESNPETWFVNAKFLKLAECYLSLERSCQGLFNGNVFENVD